MPPMRDNKAARRWTRHFVYRTERTRTTWKFRVGVVALIVLAVWLTRPWWTMAVGSSLVCDRNAAPSDAILVENFDPDYLVFERATELRQAGMAARVLVPVRVSPTASTGVNAVALATAQVMADISRLGAFEVVPIREEEPISLNAARDILAFLQREGIRSVIVVSPLFRSRRSTLVYGSTLGPAGIMVRCEPVQGTRGVETWTGTWHGVQNVTEQWLKLQYYRLLKLPSGARPVGQ